MFAEGQKVTAIGNPTAPAETIPLSLDPAGMKPGPVRRYKLYFGHGLIRRLFRNYAHAFS